MDCRERKIGLERLKVKDEVRVGVDERRGVGKME